MVGLAGALWCLSAALAAWLWAPCLPAVIGAIAGCLVATYLASLGSRRQSRLAVPAWILLATAAMAIRRWGLPVAGAEATLLGLAALTSFLAALPVLSLFHRFPRPLMLVPECALFAFPWVALLWGHRHGHLDQPVELAEPAWAAGFDLFRLFATVGVILGMLLILLVGARRSRGPSWGGLVFLLVAGALCLTALPVEKVSRLSARTEQSTRPDHTARAASKPDTPVAVVVLYQDYDPELGSYHFLPESKESAVAEPPGEGITTIHYRVAEMVEQPERLILGWAPHLVPAVVPDKKAFVRVYEVSSQVVTRPLSELLDTTDLPAATTGTPRETGPFSELAQEIVPEQERAMPLRAALRIKLWMEQNRAQAEDGESERGSVEECLIENRPVGQKTYTMAAQRLMESLGLTTRLVQGYAVRADQRGEGSFLLINESNQRCWLELRLDQSGPLVIDLYPWQGPNDSDGPQNQNLQRQLGELARARGDAGQPLPGLSAGALGFLLFLTIMALGGHAIKVYRRLRVVWCAPSRLPVWGYAAVLDRLAEVGELRGPGETRNEFALRLKDRVPSLEALTTLHQKASLGHPGAAIDNARPLVKSALRECWNGFPAFRSLPGRLHPFSWMKVK